MKFLYPENLGGLPTNFNFENYRQDEKTILEPWLKSQSYKILDEWKDGESDSFGPLSRCITIKKILGPCLLCNGHNKKPNYFCPDCNDGMEYANPVIFCYG